MLTIIKKLNGERFTVLGIVIALFVLAWFQGCQPKVTSMFEPGTKVTREILTSEVELFLARAQEKYSRLDQKDALKLLLSEQAALVSKSGTINPFGLITSLLSILGIGAVVDNVKKSKKINSLKSEAGVK